ncbi:hypothetical protein C8F04DRAFT_498031 [Mycena alexandri]|uniref:Uncharacterized protein n=1 Tax=Mycena alexandri TaxID=1745969 RepID=A0AAD6X1X3_9AGAR|nr:hypothetical protein C8F04DRAFT_498031 [Mycena alexandri]
MLQNLRNIAMKRSGSLLQTVKLTVAPKADVSNVAFQDPAVYSKQTVERQAAFKDTVNYAASAGLDAGGAESVDLAGSFHSGGSGTDTFDRLTATVRDKNNNQLYFYRQSDNTFWERIHIPRNTSANAHLYNIKNDYVKITKAQFDAKKL